MDDSNAKGNEARKIKDGGGQDVTDEYKSVLFAQEEKESKVETEPNPPSIESSIDDL